MESKKNDFVENNPYLVYSPDTGVSYAGGDSPIPPEPPAPVGTEGTFYLLEKTSVGIHLTNAYILPIDATSVDDGEELDISEFDSATVSDGKIIEIKAEAGKILALKSDSESALLSVYYSPILGGAGYYFTDAYDSVWLIMPNVDCIPVELDQHGLTVDGLLYSIMDAGTHLVPAGIWQSDY